MNPQQIADLIQRGLPGSRAAVASDDNVHFEALVIAEKFSGLRAIQRHQLVYSTLGGAMGGEIHALALKVYTPEEYAAQTPDSRRG
ncbi:MAG TPA: BolA/IbaG family iron-sulfur metabolism protein [Steroidobacteraceae bacterium]|jgi:acid stress-induced BolA-like protein IbaG/YrbA|nr:BolA/IbaG family iron-sulfur metabolism protein [Steroidobacteraceae bacterium]